VEKKWYGRSVVIKRRKGVGEQFTLTKKQFIDRSMAGDVFLDEYNNEYYYDDSCDIPFRLDKDNLNLMWARFDGKALFTLKGSGTTTERRYRWLADEAEGCTSVSDYMSDKYVERHDFIEEGWYKKEDDYIDVAINQTP